MPIFLGLFMFLNLDLFPVGEKKAAPLGAECDVKMQKAQLVCYRCPSRHQYRLYASCL